MFCVQYQSRGVPFKGLVYKNTLNNYNEHVKEKQFKQK